MDPVTKRQFKAELFEQFARIGKALAAPQRLEILELLSQGEKPVEEIAGALGVPVANTSQHLQVLRRAELVRVRRQGTYVFYGLADPAVFRLWQALRDLGERRLAEIERVVRSYLTDRSDLEPISAAELAARLAGGDVTVLDVRPAAEYDAAHIAGARSIPLDELETRLSEIPRHASVVAYCRGPYCVFADDAVRLLRAHGFDAARLETGLPDWAAAGFPLGRKAIA
jgi:rhodanese-related sulfurtransferase/DNA-binding transcriptional ArsR family regulator